MLSPYLSSPCYIFHLHPVMFRPPLNFLLLSDLHPPPLGFCIALSTSILGPFWCPPLHDHYSRDLSLTLLSCITPAKSIVRVLLPLAVHLRPVQRSHPMPCAFCAPALSFALALTSHRHPHGPSPHAASFVLSPVIPDPLSWTPRFTQCPLSYPVLSCPLPLISPGLHPPSHTLSHWDCYLLPGPAYPIWSHLVPTPCSWNPSHNWPLLTFAH